MLVANCGATKSGSGNEFTPNSLAQHENSCPKCKNVHRSPIRPENPTPWQVKYYKYLDSPEWKAKAEAAKKRAGYRCQVCYKPSSQVQLDAHHRTYERLGHELDSDITVLCHGCHELFEASKKDKISVPKNNYHRQGKSPKAERSIMAQAAEVDGCEKH